ncbi:MAG: hypothetical protein ACOZAA_11960 [Pseudomonadota bacterium]
MRGTDMAAIAETSRPFSEMSAIEIVGVIAAFAIWLAFAAFFVWFFWRIIRAQLRMPEEMVGIRKALERIADRLERGQ